MQACILAYHKIQRKDCTAQRNNKSMHAINPFFPFKEIKYLLMMHGILVGHRAGSYTRFILQLWTVNPTLLSRGKIKRKRESAWEISDTTRRCKTYDLLILSDNSARIDKGE